MTTPEQQLVVDWIYRAARTLNNACRRAQEVGVEVRLSQRDFSVFGSPIPYVEVEPTVVLHLHPNPNPSPDALPESE